MTPAAVSLTQLVVEMTRSARVSQAALMAACARTMATRGATGAEIATALESAVDRAERVGYDEA